MAGLLQLQMHWRLSQENDAEYVAVDASFVKMCLLLFEVEKVQSNE